MNTPQATESSLSRAFVAARTSYHRASKAVADRAENLFAQQPGGVIGRSADLSKAKEQEAHFTGWVYAAVKAVAQRCAAQPLVVENAAGKVLENHPIVTLFSDPNSIQTRGALLFSAIASLELTGRALLWTTKAKDGRPQLWHIPSSWIERVAAGDSFEQFFIRPAGHAGEPIPIPASAATYIYYPHPSDPRACQSPLQACAFSVEADDSIEAARYNAFKQGLFPSFAIVLGKGIDADGRPTLGRPTLTTAQTNQLIQAVRKRWLGVGNREPLILDSLIEKVEKISNSVSEMEFLESSRSVRDRILLTFGVNPVVLGEIENSNRAAAAVAEASFVSNKINPLLSHIGEALTEWLAPQFSKERLVVRFEPATARDDELRLQSLDLMLRGGCITTDELRAEFGFEPLGGYVGASLAGGGTGDPGEALAKAMRVFVGDATKRTQWANDVLFPELAKNRNGKGH